MKHCQLLLIFELPFFILISVVFPPQLLSHSKAIFKQHRLQIKNKLLTYSLSSLSSQQSYHLGHKDDQLQMLKYNHIRFILSLVIHTEGYGDLNSSNKKQPKLRWIKFGYNNYYLCKQKPMILWTQKSTILIFLIYKNMQYTKQWKVYCNC